MTRPLGHSGGQAYPAAPAGAEGVRTAPARPTSQHAPCASVQLPSLGLLASPKLLALMEAVFGFTGPCGGAGGSWSQSAGGPVADQQLPHCIAEVGKRAVCWCIAASQEAHTGVPLAWHVRPCRRYASCNVQAPAGPFLPINLSRCACWCSTSHPVAVGQDAAMHCR